MPRLSSLKSPAIFIPLLIVLVAVILAWYLNAAIFMPLFTALVAAILAWYLNEQSKRSWEQYVRKEENYKQLLKALPGFAVTSFDPTLRSTFLEQVNYCWLYCPDDVIRKAYAFLATVHTDQLHGDAEKERALAEFVVAIRHDLIENKVLKQSSLESKDFRLLAATQSLPMVNTPEN